MGPRPEPTPAARAPRDRPRAFVCLSVCPPSAKTWPWALSTILKGVVIPALSDGRADGKEGLCLRRVPGQFCEDLWRGRRVWAQLLSQAACYGLNVRNPQRSHAEAVSLRGMGSEWGLWKLARAGHGDADDADDAGGAEGVGGGGPVMVALLVRWAPAEPLKVLTATIWLSPSQMSKGGELALLLSREA